MADPTPPQETSRSQDTFQSAPAELRDMVRKIVGFERQVQHMKNRVMSDGTGIHQRILVQIKESVK